MRRATLLLLLAAVLLGAPSSATAQGGAATCSGSTQLTRAQTVGGLSLEPGSYEITVQETGDLTCDQAREAFRDILAAPGENLPDDWQLDLGARSFSREDGSDTFGVSAVVPAVGADDGGGFSFEDVERWMVVWLPILFMGLIAVVLILMVRFMPSFKMKPQEIAPQSSESTRWEDVAGVEEAKDELREVVEFLRDPKRFRALGASVPKGVLLHGPPGTGKTLLAKAVANESNAHFISISGPEIMSKFYGESEARLREIFKEAKEKSPSIIFIDEIDSIAPKREEVTGEVERRVVSQLLSLMDGLEARGKVIVIAATNRPNAIDPALRRPGRFDREIEIKVPDKRGRLEILQIHTRNMPLDTDVDQDKVAAVTHGFVGADLEYLCKEAAMKCLRRVLPELNLEDEKLSPEVLNKLVVTMSDFENAVKEVMPSAMREVYLESPDIPWSAIGGLEEVKRELQEAVEWPLRYPDLYAKLGHTMPKGVLMHGPSGTGKTLLAKAVATESEANFISVRGR